MISLPIPSKATLGLNDPKESKSLAKETHPSFVDKLIHYEQIDLCKWILAKDHILDTLVCIWYLWGRVSHVIFGQIILCCGGNFVYFRVFTSILSFYPLSANSTNKKSHPQVVTTKTISRHCQLSFEEIVRFKKPLLQSKAKSRTLKNSSKLELWSLGCLAINWGHQKI